MYISLRPVVPLRWLVATTSGVYLHNKNNKWSKYWCLWTRITTNTGPEETTSSENSQDIKCRTWQFPDIAWMHLQKPNKSESTQGTKATYKTKHDFVTIFHTILQFRIYVEKHFYNPHYPFQKWENKNKKQQGSKFYDRTFLSHSSIRNQVVGSSCRFPNTSWV
jgi:hypothetical protein